MILPPRLTSRIAAATVDAEAAFWSEIKRRFPEIKTGDLSPDIAALLWSTLESVVESWVLSNADPIELEQSSESLEQPDLDQPEAPDHDE
jgi:hypothetical protein